MLYVLIAIWFKSDIGWSETLRERWIPTHRMMTPEETMAHALGLLDPFQHKLPVRLDHVHYDLEANFS